MYATGDQETSDARIMAVALLGRGRPVGRKIGSPGLMSFPE